MILSNNIDGFVKNLFTSHCESNEAMKQSPDLKLLQTIRLLRYARNNIKRNFLRDHQYYLSGMMVFKAPAYQENHFKILIQIIQILISGNSRLLHGRGKQKTFSKEMTNGQYIIHRS